MFKSDFIPGSSNTVKVYSYSHTISHYYAKNSEKYKSDLIESIEIIVHQQIGLK